MCYLGLRVINIIFRHSKIMITRLAIRYTIGYSALYWDHTTSGENSIKNILLEQRNDRLICTLRSDLKGTL